MSSPEPQPRAIVVGAGLAGCLTALVLAKHGFAVDIYEYREDPATMDDGAIAQRSINLALSTRGLTALSAAGLGDAVRALGVPMHGRYLHFEDGSERALRYGQRGQHLLSVPRGALNTLLVEACRAAAGVAVHFEQKCVSLDLRRAAARFTGADGATVTRAADLVVGADGAFSKVRTAFLREDRFDFAQQYIAAGYKELQMRAGPRDMPPEWLHVWPRGNFMLIALPNKRAGFTCTLFMDHEEIERIRASGTAKQFFEETFPDAAQFMPDVEEDFATAPAPSMLTVRCAPYHFRDRALLVGDAAHAIVPFYGQGCNAAFEDCRVLEELLAEHGTADLGAVLAGFTRARKENADTIADLALDQYEDMASRSAQPVRMLLRKAGIWINRLFPAHWLPIYSMISFSNIPYKKAVRRAEAQDRVLMGSVLGGAALAVLAGAIKVGACVARGARNGKR